MNTLQAEKFRDIIAFIEETTGVKPYVSSTSDDSASAFQATLKIFIPHSEKPEAMETSK